MLGAPIRIIARQQFGEPIGGFGCAYGIEFPTGFATFRVGSELTTSAKKTARFTLRIIS